MQLAKPDRIRSDHIRSDHIRSLDHPLFFAGVAGPVKDRAHLVPAASSLGSEHCGIHRHRSGDRKPWIFEGGNEKTDKGGVK